MKIENEIAVETQSPAETFNQAFHASAQTIPLPAHEDVRVQTARFVREGITQAKTGDLAAARESLLNALNLDRNHEIALMWLASISDKPLDLLGYLQRVLAVNPANERAAQWAKATESLLAKSLIQQGAASHKEGMPEIAAEYFLQAAEYEPTNETAWLWLVAVTHEPENKLSYLNRVLNLNPAHEKALALFHRTKTSIARTLLKKGNAALIAGDRESAREIVADVMEYNPNLDEAWVLKGYLSSATEDKIACFEKALELNPENELARSGVNILRVQPTQTTAPAPPIEPEEIETAEVQATAADVTEENSPAEFAASEEIEQTEFAVSEQAEQTEQTELVEPPQLAEAEQLEVEEVRLAAIEVAELESLPSSQTMNSEFAPQAEESTAPSVEFSDEVIDDDAAPQQFVGDRYVAVEPVAAMNEENLESELLPELESDSRFAAVNEAETIETEMIETETLETAPAVFHYQAEDSRQAEDLPAVEAVGQAADETEEHQFAAETAFEQNDFDAEPTPAADFAEVIEAAPEETAASVPEAAAACQFCHSENAVSAVRCRGCGSFVRLENFEQLTNNELHDEGRMREFIELWQNEAITRVLSTDEYFNLGLAFINLHNVKKAVGNFEQAIKLSPDNIERNAQIEAFLNYVNEKMPELVGVSPVSSGKTIMIVDDSPTVRKLIIGKLEKHGHHVVSAIDGMDALAKMSDSIPDLILLDVTMPRMDGYQLCKLVKSNSRTKHVPVVMISGKDGFFDRVRGRMAGSTAFITKPFAPETLLQTVDNYCR